MLPRGYLSWTAMSCWNSSRDRFRREYFESGQKLDTRYLRFGKGIAEMIEKGEHKKLLPDLIVCDVREHEIRVDIKGVPILSYLDDYDPVNNVFREKKTGKIPWTQAKVVKHGQLVYYATALKHSTGKMPEYCHLDWIETKDGVVEVDDFWRENERTVQVTGKIQSFKRVFDEREVTKMEDIIVKAAYEISDAYREFIKEI